MSDSEARANAAIPQPKRALPRLSIVILLLANLYPLAGVMLWGWDAFLLLALYWMETVIVAFWTIVRIGIGPPGAAGTLTTGGGRVTRPLALAAFFTVHAGMFIGVHFLFLWTLFSGNWSARTGGVIGFFHHAIATEGLWVPLLVMFLARGAFLLSDVLPQRLLRRFNRTPAPSLQQEQSRMDGVLMGLYGRIVVMQIAIIIGAWFAMTVGSMAPLVLLILLKTAAEWIWQTGRPAIAMKAP